MWRKHNVATYFKWHYSVAIYLGGLIFKRLHFIGQIIYLTHGGGGGAGKTVTEFVFHYIRVTPIQQLLEIINLQ